MIFERNTKAPVILAARTVTNNAHYGNGFAVKIARIVQLGFFFRGVRVQPAGLAVRLAPVRPPAVSAPLAISTTGCVCQAAQLGHMQDLVFVQKAAVRRLMLTRTLMASWLH